MARKADAPEPSNWRGIAGLAALAVVAIVALVVITGMVARGGAPASNTQATSSPPLAAQGDSGQSAPPLASGGVPSAQSSSPGSTTTSRTPGAPTTDIPTPAATPTPTPVAGGAPTDPDAFDIDAQVIPIHFPLLRETPYQYRDNFLDPRDGPPDTYNHARVRPDGTAVRLHDGIDIYADEGEPLAAVFAGTIIDPDMLWQPWEPDRYGKVIVIRSDEPETQGYIALYAHASRIWVAPGDHVTRGQVLGALGRTGNAELQSIRPHLHFELRAPFELDWSEQGEDRQVDAFNPYPSLRSADPKRG